MPPPTSSPLLRLWRYASVHHRRMALAIACSILNKFFDLAPPVLIGAAVDIVVRREGSFLAGLGVADARHQLLVLAAATFLIWVLESAFEYAYAVLWRNLAQSVQHDLRLDAYRRLQHLELAYFEDRSTGGLMAILNDDVNQLERPSDAGRQPRALRRPVAGANRRRRGRSPAARVTDMIPVPPLPGVRERGSEAGPTAAGCACSRSRSTGSWGCPGCSSHPGSS